MFGWSTRDTVERKTTASTDSHQTNTDSFVGTFIILHIMVFTFGMMNYGLKVRIRFLKLAVKY